jgi:hypothetical protein
MSRRTLLAAIVGGIVVAALVESAAAYPVTFEFAGEITYVQDDDGVLDGAVSVGTPFSGLYTFESTTPDRAPASLEVGIYYAITDFSGQIGDFPFAFSMGSKGSNRISVRNGAPGASSDGYAAASTADFAGQVVGVSITLVDNTGRVFSDDSLPLFPPPLSRFDRREFEIRDGLEIARLQLLGEITSLTPEPGTLVLLGLAAVLVGRRRCVGATRHR